MKTTANYIILVISMMFQKSYTISSGVINHAFVVDEPVNQNGIEVNGPTHETNAVIILHTKVINLQL